MISDLPHRERKWLDAQLKGDTPQRTMENTYDFLHGVHPLLKRGLVGGLSPMAPDSGGGHQRSAIQLAQAGAFAPAPATPAHDQLYPPEGGFVPDRRHPAAPSRIEDAAAREVIEGLFERARGIGADNPGDPGGKLEIQRIWERLRKVIEGLAA